MYVHCDFLKGISYFPVCFKHFKFHMINKLFVVSPFLIQCCASSNKQQTKKWNKKQQQRQKNNNRNEFIVWQYVNDMTADTWNVRACLNRNIYVSRYTTKRAWVHETWVFKIFVRFKFIFDKLRDDTGHTNVTSYKANPMCMTESTEYVWFTRWIL